MVWMRMGTASFFLSVFLAGSTFANAREAMLAEAFVASHWMRPIVPESGIEEEPVPGPGLELLNIIDELTARVRVLVYRKPRSFDHEFALLVTGGRIRRAFVVSTARSGSAPVLGKFRLDVPRVNGNPWPWRVSMKYDLSPMYWALQIDGGYYFHSSPHYGNLGAPASKGCIRASYPDAMEVFDQVVNHSAGSHSIIELQEGLTLGSGSAGELALLQLLERSGWTVDDLKRAIQASFLEVRLVSKGDVEYAPGVPIDAHVRPLSGITEKQWSFPTCGGRDCWELYRRPRRILRLKPELLFKNPGTTSHSWAGRLPVFSGAQLFLQGLIPGGIAECDPFLIREVRVRVGSSSQPPVIRICERRSGVCSRSRAPTALTASELVFPLGQISEKFGSSKELYLEVESGSGVLEAIDAVYFDS